MKRYVALIFISIALLDAAAYFVGRRDGMRAGLELTKQFVEDSFNDRLGVGMCEAQRQFNKNWGCSP